MFIGHFAVALGARSVARGVPLGYLIAASFAGDVWEGVVAAFGVDDATRLYSHSLIATSALGAILALISNRKARNWLDSVLIIGVTVSHSGLDFLTATKAYLPPLAPFGLDLYQSPAATAALEAAFAVAGWILWRRSLARGRQRSPAALGVLVLLLGAQAALVAHLAILGPAVDVGALSKFVR